MSGGVTLFIDVKGGENVVGTGVMIAGGVLGRGVMIIGGVLVLPSIPKGEIVDQWLLLMST